MTGVETGMETGMSPRDLRNAFASYSDDRFARVAHRVIEGGDPAILIGAVQSGDVYLLPERT